MIFSLGAWGDNQQAKDLYKVWEIKALNTGEKCNEFKHFMLKWKKGDKQPFHN